MNVRRSALVGQSAERLFDLIEAAEDYPCFLPWCAGATLVHRDDQLANTLVDAFVQRADSLPPRALPDRGPARPDPAPAASTG